MSYKYKAFISYRHKEKDKFAASKIQRLLERFRMKGLEPWKIFRDEDELPTSSSLSDNIENALKDSEYLIVICTPALKESKWCMKEITTFKALHGGSTDHILPVLVEGEPDEVFPDQLKTTIKLVRDPVTGENAEKEIEMEPLAANITGSSKSEVNKKLKVEYLRLAAAMSGHGFDDLYNRRRRQQIRRVSLVFGMVMLAVLSFSMYSFSMNLKLEKKNQQINEQLEKTMIANAEALNGQAESLYDNGRVRDALETLLSAYEIKDDQSAITPESDLILLSEIGAYSSEVLLPCVRLPHLMDVEDFYFRNDGHRLVTIDVMGNVYLWNTDSGELIKQWKNVTNGLGRITCFINDTHDVDSEMWMNYLLNGKISGYETNAAGMVYKGFRQGDAKSEVPVEEDDQFVLYGAKTMFIVDAITGEETKIDIDTIADDKYLFAGWGDGLVAFCQEQKENNVIVLSAVDGSVIRKMTIDSEKMQVLRVLTDNFVITSSLVGTNIYALSDLHDDAYEDLSLENEDMNGAMSVGVCQTGPYVVDIEKGTTGGDSIDFDTVRFVVYDTDGNKKWTFSDSLYESRLDLARYIVKDENNLGLDLLLFIYGNKVKVCDVASGEVLDERSYDESVLDYRLGSTGMLEVTLCNGEVIRHEIGNPYTKQIMDTGAKPQQMKLCADKVAVINESGTKNVDIYITKENPDANILGDAAKMTGDENASVDKAIPSEDGKIIYLITGDGYNEVLAYSVEDEKYRLLYTQNDHICELYELENAICICGSRDITLIDKNDGGILSDHMPAKKYCYIPETGELAFYADPDDYSNNTGHEIRFTDGKNESVYQVGDDSYSNIDDLYFSEDGRRFAIVYEEEDYGYRDVHSVLLCDRDDEKGSHMVEMQHAEPNICNIRFSSDNQSCIISLNKQNMFETEYSASGCIEVIDFASGENLYTYETEKGLIVDEFMSDKATYLICSDYTLEVLDKDGHLEKSLILDRKDNYEALSYLDTGFKFKELDDYEFLIYNSNKGFVVNTQTSRLHLVIRDEIVPGNIRGFIENEKRMIIANPYQVVTYPIYSSNELYQKAKDLLGLN